MIRKFGRDVLDGLQRLTGIHSIDWGLAGFLAWIVSAVVLASWADRMGG